MNLIAGEDCHAHETDAEDIIQALAPLTFLPLQVSMEALEPLHLPPFKGSTLRGAFGVALRQTACTTRASSCRGCAEINSCVYHYIFETPVPVEARRMRKYTAAPHPFILDPPLHSKRDFNPGDRLNFGMVLVGKAIDLLPHVLMALQRIGALGLGSQRGKLRLGEVTTGLTPRPTNSLHGVTTGTSDHTGHVVFQHGQLPALDRVSTHNVHDLTPMQSTLRLKKPGGNGRSQHLRVRFLTPCRLKRGGALTDRPDFHVIFRSILRNTGSLMYFHCNRDLQLDFPTLAVAAEQVRLTMNATQWLDWERYSNRQKARLTMGGIVGEAIYEGDLGIFIPFMQLAQVLHVGKGTSMGLGLMEVHSLSETEAV